MRRRSELEANAYVAYPNGKANLPVKAVLMSTSVKYFLKASNMAQH